MIERNLGNMERFLRFSAGIGILVYLATRPDVPPVAWFAGVVAIMLVLNGIFSRCYVWYLFDLNTYRSKDPVCD